MTDLIIHPRTGEVFNPRELETSELAAFVQQSDEFKKNLYAALAETKEELKRRADIDNTNVIETDEYIVEIDKPGVSNLWQDSETVEALKAVLADLADEGLISRTACDEAIAAEVLYKPHSTKIKDLCKRLEFEHPEAKLRIEDSVKREPRRRNVRVREKSAT